MGASIARIVVTFSERDDGMTGWVAGARVLAATSARSTWSSSSSSGARPAAARGDLRARGGRLRPGPRPSPAFTTSTRRPARRRAGRGWGLGMAGDVAGLQRQPGRSRASSRRRPPAAAPGRRPAPGRRRTAAPCAAASPVELAQPLDPEVARGLPRSTCARSTGLIEHIEPGGGARSASRAAGSDPLAPIRPTRPGLAHEQIQSRRASARRGGRSIRPFAHCLGAGGFSGESS